MLWTQRKTDNNIILFYNTLQYYYDIMTVSRGRVLRVRFSIGFFLFIPPAEALRSRRARGSVGFPTASVRRAAPGRDGGRKIRRAGE